MSWYERKKLIYKQARPSQIEFHERQMELAMRGIFGEMADSFEWQLRSLTAETITNAGPGLVDIVFRPVDWSRRIREVMFAPLTRAALTGYMTERILFEGKQDEVARSEKADDVPWATILDEESELLQSFAMDPDTKHGIWKAVNETLNQDCWDGIVQTTSTAAADVIVDGVEEGWTFQQIVKETKAAIGDVDGIRSKRIARTEVTGAINAGATAQAKETEGFGLTPIKIWNLGVFVNHRVDHEMLDQEEVTGADGLFNVGGYDAPYPGYYGLPADMRCNCYCWLIVDLVELRSGGGA